MLLQDSLQNLVAAPRLSGRLLSNLYGEQVRVNSKEDLSREFLRRETVIKNRSNGTKRIDNAEMAAFDVNDFLDSYHPNLSNDDICRIYKSYLVKIGGISSNDPRQHSAKTLFRIISKSLKLVYENETARSSLLEQARKDANSCFGFIPGSIFAELVADVEQLTMAKAAKEAITITDTAILQSEEFGQKMNFLAPAVIYSEREQLFIYERAHDFLSIKTNKEEDWCQEDNAGNDSVMKWFISSCQKYLNSNREANGLFSSATQLAEQIRSIISNTLLSNGKDIDESILQIKLFDLFGESGFEFIQSLFERVDYMVVIARDNTDFAQAAAKKEPSNSAVLSSKTEQQSIFSVKDYDKLSANQKRKLARKEEQELERAIAASQQEPEAARTGSEWLKKVGFSEDFILQERALGLQKGSSYASREDNWREQLAPEGTLEYHEKKGLPAGAEKKVGQGFEEVFIPAAKKAVAPAHEVLVDISELDPWAQRAFPGTKKLNRIQSAVFKCAYTSTENMLVCAPTGAGKTNIAMLTFLRLVKSHMMGDVIDKAALKAVYIAPMKALAQEVVAKFSERLAPLGLVVREFTGDQQLTRQEVADSHLLVSTPEKFDVVTRKGGDGSLGTMVSLIIIDEVHLLSDPDRGAVIETIVARTQRYVETSQRVVRIVGLSATLPNYADVATFLKVNNKTGLFFFGPEYRPIPLDQTFVGVVSNDKNRAKRNDMMNKQAFEKMVVALERGKQVMVFVHSRKETSKTAEAVLDLSGKNGTLHLLENALHEHYSLWKRQVDKSRSVEVQQLFAKGVGVHHAGMLRADRTMTEQLFECGLIKVLFCTATLAWGVNLPAHTVIIKGTELYDPERGGFVDLSILDVLQIFGRAGRPQYDTTGHAILITSHTALPNYLGMLTHQAPIESGLIKSLADHLNAEIVNGTVTNIKEAATWMSYTFLFVRMCRNPLVYGLTFDDVFSDPRLLQLDKKRWELVTAASETLDSCMMARFDKRSGNLGVTDLGRIASHYYIKHGTIESFNNMLTPHLDSAEGLHVLCSAAEFDQLKMRPEEIPEIESLKKESTFLKVRGGADDTAGKVNILLQAFLNQARVASFTLQSDSNYVAQNGGRITRALFEICMKRGWSSMAVQFLTLSRAVGRRMRWDLCPLRQFEAFGDQLPKDVIKRLEETDTNMQQLLDMDVREIGQLVRNQKIGLKVQQLARKLPRLQVDVVVQPITRGILRLLLSVKEDFDWADRFHGFAEAFWIWVEDGDSEYIYHSEQFMVTRQSKRKQSQEDQVRVLEVTIPVREPLPPQYFVRILSDSWVGCDSIVPVSFKHLILPTVMIPHTSLLDVHPIPRSSLKNETFESLYSFSHFNPLQSHMFHVLYHTDNNILVGAPTGSGKTITAELTILRLLRERPGAKTVYVAPLKALARERLSDWQNKFQKVLGLSVLELTGDVTPDIRDLQNADILIVTPEKWDSISRGWQKRNYVSKVELIIIDEIHLLGVDRGPVLEVIVSRMRFISSQTRNPLRFVGLSTALANPRDLADWLGIGDVGVYNFRPSVRPIPMQIHIQGFPGKHYCPRMATMNKPAYAAILEHSPHKPALIFVSSRRQTRLTALDLISYCAAEDAGLGQVSNTKQFLHMSEEEIAAIAETLTDRALRDCIVFGIGIHHAGLNNHDRSIVEELFLYEKIQVLVCTSTLAWGVNLPCHLVIVKGTEYFDGKQGQYVDFPVTDVLQMMGRAGRPQFDETGVACIFVHEPKKNFYRKFLHEPFPVESSLHLHLQEHLNAEIAADSLHTVRDVIEYLTWTYYFRRLVMNPAYYGLLDPSPEGIEKHLSQLIISVLEELQKNGCIEMDLQTGSRDGQKPKANIGPASLESSAVRGTYLGAIASYYYLQCRTVALFLRRLRSQPFAVDRVDRVYGLLQVLSDAAEFDELPVRHNEEILNNQLATDVMIATGNNTVMNLDMSDPHAKTLLLLLAHCCRLALPISDYVNDTKSVLDQLPRILNACIDIAAEDEGRVDQVLALMDISKLIVQGLYLHDSELQQLPDLTAAAANRLQREKNISRLADLASLSPKQLQELARIVKEECRIGEEVSSPSGEGSVAGKGRGGGSKSRAAGDSSSDLLRAIRELPSFTVSLKLFREQDEVSLAKAPLLLVRDVEYRVDIEIRRTQGSSGSSSGSGSGGGHRQAKQKDASWWVVLSLEEQGDRQSPLLALKRIGKIEQSQRTDLRMTIPRSEGGPGPLCLALRLVCDAMRGMDQKIMLPLQIDADTS